MTSSLPRRRTTTPNTTASGHHPLRLSIAGALALLAGLCVICLGWLLDLNDPTLAFVAALTVLVGTIGLAVGASNGVRPVAIIFFAFMTSWLTLPAIYQASVGSGAWGDIAGFGDPNRLSAGFVLVLASLVAFVVAYVLPRRGDRPRAGTRHGNDRRRAAPPLWSVFLLLAVSTLLAPRLIAAVGGVEGLFSSRTEASAAIADAGLSGDDPSGASAALIRLVPSAFALAATILMIVRMWGPVSRAEGRRNGIADVFALSWGLLLVAIFMNPFTSARFLAFGAIGALILIRWRPVGARAAWVLATGSLFALILLYPLANVLRYGVDASRGLRFGTDAFLSPDFDGFQQLMNSMDYVVGHGVTGGIQTLSALLVFVPRSLWTSKATPTNVVVAEDRGYFFTNLSIPAPAEFYVDFAWLGVLLIMFVWGILARRLDDAWLAGSPSYALIGFFAIYQIILIRGPLSGSSGFIGLVLLLLFVFTRMRPREDRPVRKGPPLGAVR